VDGHIVADRPRLCAGSDGASTQEREPLSLAFPARERREGREAAPEPSSAHHTRRRLFVTLPQLKLSAMFSVTLPGADLYPFDPPGCDAPAFTTAAGLAIARAGPANSTSSLFACRSVCSRRARNEGQYQPQPLRAGGYSGEVP